MCHYKCIKFQCEKYGSNGCPFIGFCPGWCPYYDGDCDTCISERIDGTCGRDLYDDVGR